MAKIGDLQVDTINIANNAIMGSFINENSGPDPLSVAISNPLVFPVMIFSVVVCLWQHHASGEASSWTSTIKRNSDNFVFDAKDYSVGGQGSGGFAITNSILDVTENASETYNLTVTSSHSDPNGGGGSASFGLKTLRVLYRKR